MKIAVFGGTGFIGRHIMRELKVAGHELQAMVRPGSEDKWPADVVGRQIKGTLVDQKAVIATVTGCEAVIYSVGLLKEFPRRGITFQRTHVQGVAAVLAAAQKTGVRRFILISANGVKPWGTPYQTSKYAGEQLVRSSALSWTIIRPSLVFGPPEGTMDFATMLLRQVIKPPLPGPLFYTRKYRTLRYAFKFTPVHVQDVAAIITRAIPDSLTFYKTISIGGPEVLSWEVLLRRIAETVGKRKIFIPVPADLLHLKLRALAFLPWLPITADQLQMLREGNVVFSRVFFERYGIHPKHFIPLELSYLLSSEH